MPRLLARPVLSCAVLCLPVARFIYVNLSPPLSAPAQVAVYVVESRSILLIQVVNLNLFRLHVGLNFFPLSRSLSLYLFFRLIVDHQRYNNSGECRS